MSGHVTARAVWDGERIQLDDPMVFRAAIRRMKFGAGETLIIRVESEAEAWRHSDVKHLFGHIYAPVLEFGETGYTKTEFHTVEKAFWMPDDGRTSITELNREELQDYTRLCEKQLREEFPDAFELWARNKLN